MYLHRSLVHLDDIMISFGIDDDGAIIRDPELQPKSYLTGGPPSRSPDWMLLDDLSLASSPVAIVRQLCHVVLVIAGRRRRRRELVVKSCYRVVPEVAETEERVLQVKHVEAVLDILLCHGLVALHDQAPGHRNRALSS